MTEIEKMVEGAQRIVDKWLSKEEHRTLEDFISNFEELIGYLFIAYEDGVFSNLYEREDLEYIYYKELESEIKGIEIKNVCGVGYSIYVTLKGEEPDYD